MIHNIYYSFLIPLITLLIILFATKNRHLPKLIRLFISLLPALMLILALLSYIIFYFVGGGINEVILYHLSVGFGEIENIQEFYPFIILIASTLMSTVAITIFTYRVVLNTTNRRYSSFALIFTLPLFYFHPMALDINDVIRQYRNNPTEDDIAHFHQLNREPLSQTLILDHSKPKKNIIILFLEGTERTFYANNGLFPDLMPNLKRIANENIEFTAIRQMQATSNTITGSAASLCGVPLINRTTGHEKNRKDTFLPNAICFGDILKLNHYRNLFITGYNKNFTHKGTFYSQHGANSEDLFGNDEIENLLDYSVVRESWLGGIFDADLFNFIYQQYDQLSDKKQPFSIVINTLDTHAHDGYLDRARCQDFQYPLYQSINMPNAIHCTDRALGKFYDQLKNHPNANNTILVIASDHEMPATSISYILFDAQNRSNTFIIVDFENQVAKQIDREGLQFDIVSTILNYAGWDIDELHFGRNLFNPKTINMLDEFGSPQIVDDRFSLWGRLFSYFWLPKKSDLPQ